MAKSKEQDAGGLIFDINNRNKIVQFINNKNSPAEK